MNISGFTSEALDTVQQMLYAESQANPLEGECGQKAKRQSMKKPRTAAQRQADQNRSQANQGQDNIPSATRSEAAKKAAATRKKCKGAGPTPGMVVYGKTFKTSKHYVHSSNQKSPAFSTQSRSRGRGSGRNFTPHDYFHGEYRWRSGPKCN